MRLLGRPARQALRTLYCYLSVTNTAQAPPRRCVTANPPGGLLRCRRTREHVQAAGSRLRKRLQRSAFGSAGVGSELLQSAADEPQMNRADHFRVAMSRLEQGAAT